MSAQEINVTIATTSILFGCALHGEQKEEVTQAVATRITLLLPSGLRASRLQGTVSNEQITRAYAEIVLVR